MLTPLMFPIWKQRDPRWSNQRLGTADGITIGGYGCLISVIAMAQSAFDPSNQLTPGQTDDLFTNNNGYANQDLVVWNAVSRLLPHVAHVGFDPCVSSPAPIVKLKQHLDNGGLAALQVGFGGTASRMHWLLADGYNGDNIVKCDPWFGDETDFTSKDSTGHFRYGSGVAAQDILGIHYFAQGVAPVQAVADPPPSPVAKLPAENPIPIEETVPNPRVDPPLPTVPETPAATDGSDTPGKGGALPEWEASYVSDPAKRPVLRDGAFGIDVTSGVHVVPTIANGTVIDVAGYFTFNGIKYARTVYSVTHGKWNGLDVTFFDQPTGQVPDGPLPVTVVPPAPAETPTATVPEPRKRLTLLELIIEWIARITAAHIKKRNS